MVMTRGEERETTGIENGGTATMLLIMAMAFLERNSDNRIVVSS